MALADPTVKNPSEPVQNSPVKPQKPVSPAKTAQDKLKLELAKAKQWNVRYQKQIQNLKKKAPKEHTHQEEPTATTTEASSTGKDRAPLENGNPRVHTIEWKPRNCPECAQPNMDFKDETKCAKCGLHLGSVDYAKSKLKACPNCPLDPNPDAESNKWVRI